MGRFVQRVQGQPSPGIGDGPLAQRVAVPAQKPHQTLKRPGQFPTQTLCLEGLPFVKVRAIGQGKAGQKVAPRQSRRFGERLQTGRTNLVGRVIVPATQSQQLPETVNVQPQVRVRPQLHRLVIYLQPIRPQTLV
jgi:hypothetical protein